MLVETVLVGVVLFRLLRYATTPVLKSIGFYRYYSPMLFTMPTPTATELHLGTSYDFFHQSDTSPKQTLLYLSEGLVHLCTAVERGEIPRSENIQGTTYFLSEHTLEQFGFRSRRLGPFQLLMFLINYVELCILQSLSKGEIRLVRVRRARRVQIRAGEIVKRKALYERWHRILSTRREAALARAPFLKTA